MNNLFFISVFFLFAVQCAARAQSSLRIEGKQCEYRETPLGIDTDTPYFTWQLADSKQTKGQVQTAYRILVASSEKLLSQGKADLWDSGKVETSQSVLVKYAGKPLTSNQDCYWKVQVYDKEGKASRWSAVGRFSIGLLSAADCKGKWIYCPDAREEQHIWYRKNIELEENVRTAFLHVSSMGYHELYVNGVKADGRILAPALTRLDKRVLYVTYDVAPLLKKGKNTLAFWTGPGWARYEYFKKKIRPALWAQLNLETTQKEKRVYATDDSWKCKVSSSGNTGYSKYMDNGGEYVDARKYIDGWNMPELDDTQWGNASETTLNVKLSAHNVEPSKVLKTIHPRKIVKVQPGIYKVDMGENFTGWISVKMHNMNEGDTVLIRVADDYQTLQDFAQKNIYICRGTDEETFCNRFNFSGGRYVNISGVRNAPNVDDIAGYAVGTDLERVGNFVCSDTLFNEIYKTDLWTYRSCTVEGYTFDCPHRERLGYGEEVFATAWGIGFPNYKVGALYQKHITDWVDVQERNGWIHHTAPQINEHYGGPLWSSAGMNTSWEYYVNYGDKRVLETVYPSVVKWLEFLHCNSQWGLLESYSGGGKFLGDWAKPSEKNEFGGSPESFFFNNCVYAFNLNLAVRMANVLGKDQDAKLYALRLRRLKKRINQHFLDDETRLYMNGDQVQTAFPLWQDIVPDSLRNHLMNHFRCDLGKENPYFDMGSSGLPVMMKFLTEKTTEFDGLVANVLRSTSEPGYGYFLKCGENTWPEFWKVDVPSRIHTCYTGISSWFIKRIGGIIPDEEHPGYQHIIIRPAIIEGMDFAKTQTASLYGNIQSEWKRGSDSVLLKVHIPVNCKATVYLPNGELREVSSGEYEFNCMFK